jgi:hypothetical protein
MLCDTRTVKWSLVIASITNCFVNTWFLVARIEHYSVCVCVFVCVLLTVHLSIFIATDQLNAQILLL